MELFKLFGTIGINSQEAVKQLGGITKKAADTENNMKKIFETIG